MDKYRGHIFLLLMLAPLTAWLAAFATREVIAPASQHAHVRSVSQDSAANASGAQCQTCSKEVCMMVDILEDCSSNVEVVRYYERFAAMERRINQVLNISAEQEWTIMSLEALVDVLEQKIETLRELCIEN